MMIKTAVESFDKTKIALNHFQKENRKTVIIICHGFWMSKDAKPFLELSRDIFKFYDVMAMDQRGHGGSEGFFTFSTKEHLDIEAVINYARPIYKDIYLMGFSLGAASSIIEVAKNKNVSGLILVSPPISFKKIENRFLDRSSLIPALQKFGGHLFKLRPGNVFAKKFEPENIIDRISPIPILIIHGENDPIIFSRHSEILYQKAKEPKKLVLIKNGLHADDLYLQNPDAFIKIVNAWIEEVKRL